jgi:hypothetical protein
MPLVNSPKFWVAHATGNERNAKCFISTLSVVKTSTKPSPVISSFVLGVGHKQIVGAKPARMFGLLKLPSSVAGLKIEEINGAAAKLFAEQEILVHVGAGRITANLVHYSDHLRPALFCAIIAFFKHAVPHVNDSNE